MEEWAREDNEAGAAEAASISNQIVGEDISLLCSQNWTLLRLDAQ